ncbi:hypothetical protein Tco_0595027 [Tanacetum coccineum]
MSRWLIHRVSESCSAFLKNPPRALLIEFHGEVASDKDGFGKNSFNPDEFESLLGDIIRQKEEVKGISDPVARRKACFNQGRVIHSPKKASISAISHIFPNNNLEDSFKMGDDDLNFIPNKELDKEDLIPIPVSPIFEKSVDFLLLSFLLRPTVK